MATRRAMYGAAVRLATFISAIAVALAVALDALGQISPVRFVTFVAAVGFVSSWTVTGRVERAAQLSRCDQP